jgi:transposase-like protein
LVTKGGFDEILGSPVSRIPDHEVASGHQEAQYLPEFRQRAVQLVREGTAPVAKIAKDLGISDSCLRNWITQADADENGGQWFTSDEKKELAELRRKNRLLERENEILRRAAAYFARENVLPK